MLMPLIGRGLRQVETSLPNAGIHLCLCCVKEMVREIPCSGVKLNLNLRLHNKNLMNCRMCLFTLKKSKGTRAILDCM